METYDYIEVLIDGKGLYENCLDENGKEIEWLDGVGLTNGHYCKHYTRARDWNDKSVLDDKNMPFLQHYCLKHENFMGWACCCWTNANCFEEGKSAGVKRVLNKIRRRREKEGLIVRER